MGLPLLFFAPDFGVVVFGVDDLDELTLAVPDFEDEVFFGAAACTVPA